MWFSEHPSQRCQRTQRPSPSLPHLAVSHPCFPRTPGRRTRVQTHPQLGPGDLSPYPSSRPPTLPPLSFPRTIPGRQEAPPRSRPHPPPPKSCLSLPSSPPFCPSPPPRLHTGPMRHRGQAECISNPQLPDSGDSGQSRWQGHRDKNTNLQSQDLETTCMILIRTRKGDERHPTPTLLPPPSWWRV